MRDSGLGGLSTMDARREPVPYGAPVPIEMV